jgi:spore maturation protein CgeB
MKLLLVGSDYTWSIERKFYEYLLELQVEVELFPAQNHFYSYYYRSILHKLIYRAGLSGVIGRIGEKLRKTIDRFGPDIVFVFKGMEIQPSVLQWIKTKNILLVNYNPDNPFIFSGSGSGNENIKKSLPYYDLHFTYNLEIRRKLEMAGYRTAFLPFGYDVSESLYELCSTQEETRKACFVGNPDQGRASFLNALADKGVEIDVYGKDWNRFVSNEKIKSFPAIYGDEFWMILRRYRVQLNLMRIHNEDSHNMRSFEIPAIAGIMLAPDTTENRMFFKDGEEVFLFSGIDHCAGQIDSILRLPKNAAEEIRRRARARSIQSKYSYKERTIAALAEIKRVYHETGHYPL